MFGQIAIDGLGDFFFGPEKNRIFKIWNKLSTNMSIIF